MERVIDFDAVMSVKHDAEETEWREPFNIHVVKDGTPIVEFQDSTAIAFDAEDLVNEAVWFMELEDPDDCDPAMRYAHDTGFDEGYDAAMQEIEGE